MHTGVFSAGERYPVIISGYCRPPIFCGFGLCRRAKSHCHVCSLHEPFASRPKGARGTRRPSGTCFIRQNNFFKVIAYRLSESPKVCIPDGFAAGGPAAREGPPDGR